MGIPVSIVAGWLGSGKTTAISSLLAGLPTDERIALVVNDFGAAAIDAASLGDRVAHVAEIRGACACCSAPAGFSAAVGGLVAARPTRILIEPSGLAEPADLVDTLRRAPYRDAIALGPLVVVADPAVLAARPELRAQAEDADWLVLNRVDLATEADLAAVEAWLAALWPGPLGVVRTVRGAPLDGGSLARVLAFPADRTERLAFLPVAGLRPGAPRGVDHGAAFAARSWFWAADQRFDHAGLHAALAGLEVARAKGLFRTDQGWWRFELANGVVDAAPTSWRRDSRVDVIAGIDADFTAIQARFAGALLAGGAAVADRVEVVGPGGRAVFDRAALAALPGGVPDVGALVPKRAGEAARLSAVLARVGAEAASEAVVVASDGYVTPPVPLAALRDGLLVHSLGGAALPENQGGPLRLLVPGDAGPAGACSNVKGVVRIVLR